MNNEKTLQDPFLEILREKGEQVSIYLVNGIKLTGVVDAFDSEVIFLKNSVSQMVYKHAVSTVVPASGMRVFHEKTAAGEFVLKDSS